MFYVLVGVIIYVTIIAPALGFWSTLHARHEAAMIEEWRRMPHFSIGPETHVCYMTNPMTCD